MTARKRNAAFFAVLFVAIASAPWAFAQIAVRQPDNNTPVPAPKMGLIRAVAVSSDGKFAMAGDSERVIRVWNIKTRELIRVIPDKSKHRNTIACYAFSADGKLAVVGNHRGDTPDSHLDADTLTFWDLEAGRQRRALELKDEAVSRVAISPDGTRVVSVSLWKVIRRERHPDDKHAELDPPPIAIHVLRLWDTVTGKLIQTLSEIGQIGPVAFSPDAEFIVSPALGPIPPFGEKRTWFLRKWDAKTGLDLGAKAMATEFFKMDASVIACAPNSKKVAIGQHSGLSLWNLETGKLEWFHSTQVIRDGARFDDWPVTSLAFSLDGSKIVASGAGAGFNKGHGCVRGGITVLDVVAGREPESFVSTNECAHSVLLLPDGRTLVGWSSDVKSPWPTPTAWDARTGKLIERSQ